MTWGLPRTLAVTLLEDQFPEVARIVAVPVADDGFWVAVVATGSASAALVLPAAEA
jgi:hypothetical protein